MKKLIVNAAIALTAFLVAAPIFAGNAETIKIAFDRENCVYAVGEQANFTVAAVDADGAPADSGKMTVKITNDGRTVLAEETIDLSEKAEAAFNCTLNQPGFIKVFANAESADGSVKKEALAGAGFDPESIKPGMPKPTDFDEYWAKGKEEVRAIPIDMRQRKLEEFSDDACDMYAVNFATINGQRLYGYLGIPKQGQGPYPTIVNVAWAGLGFGPDPGPAKEGFVIFTLNVFPYDVPIDQAERQKAYDEYNKSLGTNYFEYQPSDRDAYFYRAPILGLDRAIDWLAEQDFVDETRIGYHGTSQGGGFGLILTGMNKHISEAVCSVPAICDHGGLLEGRNSGWPQIVDNWRWRNDPAERDKVKAATSYYDAVNFASNIDVPITVTVGFIDVTCCPSSVYAAYNVIPSKNKRIKYGTTVGHVTDVNYWPSLEEMKKDLKAPKCPLPGNWKFDPKFSDEFNGTFDDEKWYRTNPTWLGRQPGFFSKDNVTVEDGFLKLTARNESMGDPEKGYKDFTTAAVKSKERVRYGYFEVRSKPMNSKASSSFWFYADDADRWTEIDVYEMSGAHPEHGQIYHMNLHVMRTPETGDKHISQGGQWKAPYRFADDFHRYGLLWTPEKICWYVDDQLVRESENTYWTQELTVNFDSETMPEWFGLPDPAELPATFQIDYIRHWMLAD
ncbi:MAG: acetylxylan esterase [Thermoguttaceae bacterium]|nr:acetylxylan esterase [Thermoguttaceae bacterium]